MDKKEKIAAVVIGGSVAAGAAALVILEASKLPLPLDGSKPAEIKLTSLKPNPVIDGQDAQVIFKGRWIPNTPIIILGSFEFDQTFPKSDLIPINLKKNLVTNNKGEFSGEFNVVFDLRNTSQITKGVTLSVLDKNFIDPNTGNVGTLVGTTDTKYFTIIPKIIIDPVIPPLNPEVITFFDVSPNSGQAPLVVAISINVTGTRSRVVFKFGDGTGNVTKTSGNTHVINHNYLSPGNYNGSVEVTKEDGKSDIVNFTVSASSPTSPPPGQTFAITSFFQSKSSGNVPFDISISASVNEPLASASIEWGDGSVTSLGSNLSSDHTYSQEGIYNGKLIVISVDGQSAQRSFQVNANPDVSGPQGDIIVTGKSESVYTFFANFSGSGLSYRWNFGDGSPLETGPQTISHAYGKVGTFTVSVVVTDLNGKTGTDTVQVSIRETDLQAELGEAQILRLTNTGSFDYAWKITNVTQRQLLLEYTLRLFDQNSKQIDSRIINFGLQSFASLTVNYNLPNLADGTYNLELEVQDGNTKQLVAFDSQVLVIQSAPPTQPQIPLVGTVSMSAQLTKVDFNTIRLITTLGNNNNFPILGSIEVFPTWINPDGSKIDLTDQFVTVSMVALESDRFFIQWEPFFGQSIEIPGAKITMSIQFKDIQGSVVSATRKTISF